MAVAALEEMTPEEIDKFFQSLHDENQGLKAKIKELKQALDDTNKELCVAIEEVNNHLAEGVTSSTENEPDYWVFQTVHDNQVLLSKTQQPEVK